MRIRPLVFAAVTSLAIVPDAGAVRSGRSEPPVVANGRAERLRRAVTVAPAHRMQAAGLAGWTALLDRDTDVPLRMWGPGTLVPGAVANPSIAEAAARTFLERHLALLAPGASMADFTLVANQVSNGTRSIGFLQHAGGLRVVGGAIGIAFQADRVTMVSSTALPNVRTTSPTSPVSRASAFTAAHQWLARTGFSIRSRDAASLASAPPVVIPIVRKNDVTYHVAHELAVEDTAKHERWSVWVDATSGAPISRRSTVMRGSGRVLYEVPVRTPQRDRFAAPVALGMFVANGSLATSTLDGDVTFAGNGPVDLTASVTGPLVSVFNSGGANFSGTQSLADGGRVQFGSGAGGDEHVDAQLTAFIHANVVKQFAKRLDPDLPYIDQQLFVSVNEADVCNAFSTGDDIHFFASGTFDDGFGTIEFCENTARIPDVVYHEFGHSWHINTIIPGVGQFHPSVSEGLADFTSSLITNDSALARGFFSDRPDTPLRDLDPVDLEKRFPDNATGEPHDEGEIIGGALFDLKKSLEAKLGVTAGRAQVERIFLSIMKRSVDLLSAYPEALLGDDDDGDLSNGTPNKCEIDAAFGVHGLADATLALSMPPPTRDGLDFTVPATISAPGNACGATTLPTLTGVTIDFKRRGSQIIKHVALAKTGDTFAGSIPGQPDGSVIQYKLTYTLSTGQTREFPSSNPAEPLLELYVGPIQPIACFDFESGAQGWTGDSEWQAGAPLGLGGDPDVARAGTGVFGLDLDQDGLYSPNKVHFAESPAIDLRGATKVRLQFHRWLDVEDGQSDRARILANGTQVWTNIASEQFEPPRNHTDREWRFADLNLSAQTATGSIKLRFELRSNEFGEFGGWNLDDVCLVEMVVPGAGCGNGQIETGEACDDGNTTDGDGCSAMCQTEGSGPIEPTGQAVLGPENPDPVVDDEPAAGCCSTGGGSPVAPAGFGVLLAFALLRPRKWCRR
jgi:cysteine-rich repeat protein